MLLLTVQTLNEQWSSDHWLHQAVLVTLQDDLIRPLHPLVPSRIDSEYITPYTVGQAALNRLLGLEPVPFLQLSGVVNLVLLLVAFWFFVGELAGDRRAVVWALVATLVFWGPRPWRWSGFLNLNSIGFGLHYPATFATAGALLAGWLLLRWTADRRPWRLVVLAPVLAVVAVAHPFTGAWASAMLVALAVGRRAVRPGLAVCAAGAVALAFAWPYYSVPDLLSASSSFRTFPVLYERLPERFVAASPGLLVVWSRFRDDRLDPLWLMFAGGVSLYAAGFVLDDTNLARAVPLLVLPLHVGIGLLVVRVRDRRDRGGHRAPLALALGGVAVVGLVGVVPGLARTVPRDLLPASLRDDAAPLARPYRDLADHLEYGTVVLAEGNELRRIVAAYGGKTIVPGYDAAFVDDVARDAERERDVLRVPRTPAARTAAAIDAGFGAVLCASAACADGFTGARTEVGPGLVLVRLEG